MLAWFSRCIPSQAALFQASVSRLFDFTSVSHVPGQGKHQLRINMRATLEKHESEVRKNTNETIGKYRFPVMLPLA